MSGLENERFEMTHVMYPEISCNSALSAWCRVGGVLHRPHRATGEGLLRAAGGHRNSRNTDQITGRLQGSMGRPLGSGEDRHLRVRCSTHIAYLSTLQE